MQFQPSVWGPFFWHVMHIIAIAYPKNPTYTDKKCAKEFYESLVYLIPCSICRQHYKEYIVQKPIITFLDNRTDLIRWTLDIHNKVNKQLSKPEWTLEEMLIYYERLGRRNRSPIWTKDDMNEVDYRSFVKGFITGSFIITILGGVIYYVNNIK
jgi:hypothetical protein